MNAGDDAYLSTKGDGLGLTFEVKDGVQKQLFKLGVML
jgi:hypothetical protein